MIDLHVHSTASDGTFTPTELVKEALKKKLTAFALTDHDTVIGIMEAKDAAEGKNITIIPGVELSTDYNGQEIHILGLFIEEQNKEFLSRLEQFNEDRGNRNKKMITLLQENGVSISLEALQNSFPNAVLTRAHFARYLLVNDYVSSIQNAFEVYLGEECPCYVPRNKVTPQDAITVIRKANGIPVLAHPLLYHMEESTLKDFLLTCKKEGLVGIEAIYSLHSKEEELMLIHLANEIGLLITGGSDFHGLNKPSIELGSGKGNLEIPDRLLSQFHSF